MYRNIIGTSAAALATGVLLASAVPLTANRHVTLTSNQAAAGSDALLSLNVPNVSDTPPAGDEGTSEPGAEVTARATAEAVPYHALTVGEPDVLARVLGIGGLVLGVIALVVVITTRRPTAGTPDNGGTAGSAE
jgi:hypothetical protein